MSSVGDVVNEIAVKLEKDCANLNEWMCQNQFKLNAEKTHLMVVGTEAKLKKKSEMSVPMNGIQLKETNGGQEVLLGVVIQNNLKWTAQVEKLCSKLKQRLLGLEKLRSIMSKSSKSSIIQGVFQSVLCYCLPLFGGCSQTELNMLQTLQNRAARIALNFPARSNRDVMFSKLGWMTVRQLVAYHTLMTIFKVRVTSSPEYLSRILKRENHNGQIIMKNVLLQLYRSSFVFRGAVLWNRIPRSLREDDCEKSFKLGVREWVLNNVNRFNL